MTDIAQLALEFWRASGARTDERLRALVFRFGESYYGSSAQWPASVAAAVQEQVERAMSQRHAWEVKQ